MEKTLSRLFDRQRFAQEPRLRALIEDTERRYGRALSEEDLSRVSAAGETVLPSAQEEDDRD